ncbi:hypothetical protein [Rhodoferax sp.]|uniref:hypothetical protein n=1 Tax=Rhodoferax sp. TaxID=50421 RepID=UPI00262AA13A|nr:hypothetical protein [Rhodoferax sp.]MDD2917392.1 hypothetical protein [Rhodoferax sp.]
MTAIHSSIQNEIEELKEKIEKTRIDLIKEEAVLEYLVSKAKKSTVVAESQRVIPAPQVATDMKGVIDLSKFSVTTTTSTFPSDVWAVVSKLGSQEFTAPLVHDVMAASGYEVAGKSPKARISAELAKLVEDGKIVRTFEGKGSTPNRYSLSIKGENLSAQHTEAFNLQPSPNKGTK